ncbi:MAG: TMEM53 family protein, partial [Deltaproteobacteria bacterium]|nr:TMEM53 family protein [Deltaproteobacteria bacterium]
PRLRVVIFGWHDALDRHLQNIGRLYEPHGHAVHFVRSDSRQAFWSLGRFESIGEGAAHEVAKAQREDPRPLLFHAFSNAGFWNLSVFLESAMREHKELLFHHIGTVLDSAPGFVDDFGLVVTTRIAAMAFMPGILMRLGRSPRYTHPLLTPLLWVFFGGWYLLSPLTVERMRQSPFIFWRAHTLDAHHPRPLLVIYGVADALVEVEVVEKFLEKSSSRGIPIRFLKLDSGHVRHFLAHRRRYEREVNAFIDWALELRRGGFITNHQAQPFGSG